MSQQLTAGSNTELVFVGARAPWRAALIVLLVLAAVFGSWKAFWWFFGNDVARNAFDREGAEAALRWAPDDPQAYFTRGVITERRSEVFDTEASARTAMPFYEEAARLAPNDYRMWVELGRAQERAGDREAAITAMRRGVELAPHYALARWQFGNLLLRANRIDEAFAELRLAGEADEAYRSQVVQLAWRFYDQEIVSVLRVLGSSAGVQSELMNFLINKGQLDDAMQVWMSMKADDVELTAKSGENLEGVLFKAKRFRNALKVHQVRATLPSSEAGGQSETRFPPIELARISNGGFEADVPPAGRDLFGWQVARLPGARIELDANEKQSGARSLRFSFTTMTQIDLRLLRQTIPVEPGTRYRLSFYVRTEDVRSVSLPFVEVADGGNDTRVLAASNPVANGTSDWQRNIIDLVVPAETDGIIVRFARQPCAEVVCPILGRIWYDEFALEKLGGASSSRN